MNTDDTKAAGARALAIDPGERRSGLALSDELGITAQGLETFEGGGPDKLVRRVAVLVSEHRIAEVVVGMPLSMSGGELEGTRRSRELAARIERECGVAVVLRDERMTSREAERIIAQAGGIRRAGDIDRIAAVLLLQGYLEERSRR